ncbi:MULTISPECIES: calcium-binding protein [unclassified Roseofilum]|uniref:calcium-binding protein n=1 Tax=unclassified Roseofilum TaxID=2620099 RepID=UPI001B143342|nr:MULTISPECIES: calcium-binding protein [unclassified Roseofilum]MBP0011207.1 calcium-binding protein [Roseofilum sp. Belize Diploria]MBP0014104.1 calcium-binding protein [Roseofilum sp. SID3]MBP0022800.1 calcium-binding protein [Roseofilum sp. SID2]MBP0035652.1 calcium-binding protein [Roseofilum sp. Belize BBD 4]MBP0036286.1 calcium-binding protein [Roseofilum sp. SID1]
MVATPDFSFFLPRLLATDFNDFIVLNSTPGQNSLINYPGGVWALAGNDTIFGSNLNEVILGNLNNDQLRGGSGGDRLLGGQNEDLLFGENGDDLLRGDLGDDQLFGEAGNDTLRGGQGNDVLNGGIGQDFIIGDLGFDNLSGGAGFDTLVFRTDEANLNPNFVDVILDWNPTQDLIGLTNGLSFSNLGFDTSHNLAGGGANDTLIIIGATGQSLGIVVDYTLGLGPANFTSITQNDLQVGSNVFFPLIP